MLSSAYVILFNQVCTLASIESRDDIKGLVVKCNRGVEVPTSIQTCNLGPSITRHIVNFAFIHWFTWKWASNCVNLRSTPSSKHWSQCVSPSLKDHITPLFQPFINELIARLRGFPRFTAACQEDPSFFVLHRHKVCRYLYVYNVRTIRVRREVVHEEVVRVIDEEVKCINHLSIIPYKRHLDCLLYNLRYSLLCLLLLLQ